MNKFFRVLKRLSVLLLLLMAYGNVVLAETSESSISLKAGLLMEGEVYANPPDQFFGTDSGLMLQFNLETMLAKKMSAGVFYLRANTGVYGESATINTYGITLKAHLNPDKSVKIRPGIAFGYQKIGIDATNSEDVTGLDIGAFIEILFSSMGGYNVVTELGIISQPAGGNTDIDLTFAPIVYLTGGVSFGL